MGKFIDLTGQKFGKLVVLSRAENKHKHVRWNCLCECGNITITNGSDLRSGDAISCGCYKLEMFDKYRKQKITNLVGRTFGRLTVVSRAKKNRWGHACWNCVCTCGNAIIVEDIKLKRNATNSCACLRNELASQRMTTHGLSHHRLYHILAGMQGRCYNPNNPKYKRYGGRGIKVCDEWLDKENGFINFYNWSMANGYADNLSIDRIDNDKGYSPKSS